VGGERLGRSEEEISFSESKNTGGPYYYGSAKTIAMRLLKTTYCGRVFKSLDLIQSLE
jgi:hypothetical protein